MAMMIEDRVRDLERRVGELEGKFGFISDQLSEVHKSLLAFQKETTEEFGRVHTEIKQFRDDMPDIVAKAVAPLIK